MRGQHQQVRGLQYYYLTQGDREQDIVFLHGFLGSHAIFNEALSEIDLASTHRLVSLDLLGHGASEGAELHYRFSAKEQVADLAYFIRHYCQKPVILVGYSMGARLALSLATQYPSLCKGLVLESGHFGISSETERQSRQSLDAQRADEIMSDYSSFLRYWEDISHKADVTQGTLEWEFFGGGERKSEVDGWERILSGEQRGCDGQKRQPLQHHLQENLQKCLQKQDPCPQKQQRSLPMHPW